jgi:biopolymer transport protein ExbD
MAQSSSRPGEVITAITVTPLVDVVLVLLIVLMVSASYTVSRAIPMELPKAKSGETKSLPLAVSIDDSGNLFLDGEATNRDELAKQIHERKKREGSVSAMIAADGKTRHRSVVGVIDLLRNEGVTQFAINVAPEDLK